MSDIHCVETGLRPLGPWELLRALTVAADQAQKHEGITEVTASDIVAIANRHARTCELTTDLPQVLATLLADVAVSLPFRQGDLQSLFGGHLADVFAGLNGHWIHWEDPETFVDLFSRMEHAAAREAMRAWLEQSVRQKMMETVHAFILGSMTAGEPEELEDIRRRATLLRDFLVSEGYVVHAPCRNPPAARPSEEVTEEDQVAMARAALVITLSDPPALGVGILLGEATRSNPAAVFITHLGRQVSPLVGITGDPGPHWVDNIDDDAMMLADVAKMLHDIRPEILGAAARKRETWNRVTGLFDEYAESYEFSRALGLDIVVPGHRGDRVRLVCTHLEVFATATYEELRAISNSINALLFEAEFPGEGAGSGRHELAAPAEATRSTGQETNGYRATTHTSRDPNDQTLGAGAREPHTPQQRPPMAPGPAPEVDSAMGDDWDQPPLFSGYTRHESADHHPDVPDEVELGEWLDSWEINSAEMANQVLRLSESSYQRLLHEARVTRYRESLAGAGASRVELASPDDWIYFYRHILGGM